MFAAQFLKLSRVQNNSLAISPSSLLLSTMFNMSSQPGRVAEAAHFVGGQTLFLGDGLSAASGVRVPPVNTVYVQQAAVPRLGPVELRQLPVVTDAAAFQQKLHRRWHSFLQSLQNYYAYFHPGMTGHVDLTQPLPPPRSAEDAQCQAQLYKQWSSYLKRYYAFMAYVEQLQRSSLQERTVAEEIVFSQEDMDLLENIPGILDLAGEMGFSV